MDDFTYNESNAVPEPTTLALWSGLGVMGLADWFSGDIDRVPPITPLKEIAVKTRGARQVATR